MSALTKKRGRPTVYTPELADEICERLSQGESLATICRDPHMPPESTVREWVGDDRGNDENGRPGFAARYARAREQAYQRLADELLELADADCTGPDGKPDNALVQQRRLQVDTRKWLLSKLLPKQYGDRVTAEIAGDATAPVLRRIELIAVPARHPGVLIADGRDEAAVTPPRACLLPRGAGTTE